MAPLEESGCHKAASLVHRGLGRVEFFDLTAREVAGLDALLAGQGEKNSSVVIETLRRAWVDCRSGGS